jgi:type I restriction enzyme S subunit
MSLVFNQPGFQRTAAALATGTTERRRLKETDFLTITIPLPPLLDQRRIVELVGSVTRALQATLAESSKARIAFETLGESAWESNERVSLGTLGEVFTGKTPSTKIATYWEPAGVPFVTPGDIGPGLYVRNAERSISEAGARKVRVFPPTTVLQVCIGATIGKVGLLGISAACNQQVNALVGLDEVDAKFLTIVLGSSSGTGLIRSTAGHTTMPILKKSAWLELIVPWPRRQMREKLSSLTTTMDQLAAESIEYSKSLRSLQAALINDLLTGARRIPDTYDNLVNMP